jgi:hypothetical protein
LTTWSTISVLVSRQPLGPNQEATFSAPTSFPLGMVGYHDFAARQFNYRIVFGWPDGWTLWGGQMMDDQREFMKFQRAEMAPVFAITSFAAACLTIFLLEAGHYIGRRLHSELPTRTGKPAAKPAKLGRRLSLAKLWHSKWPERSILAAGLVLLLAGSITVVVPTPVVVSHDEATFQMAGPPPSIGLLNMQLNPAQMARIVVEFDRNATARREVRLLVEYGEWADEIGSYVNQSTVTLFLYWGNFSLPAMLITAFDVVMLYYGNNTIQAIVAVTRYQNSLATSGLLLVGWAALPLWSFLVVTWVKHRERRSLYNLNAEEMTEG